MTRGMTATAPMVQRQQPKTKARMAEDDSSSSGRGCEPVEEWLFVGHQEDVISVIPSSRNDSSEARKDWPD